MSMIDCAYYREGGLCSFGCWEEPRCITDEPEGGWLYAEAQALRGYALEMRGEPGTHGAVKMLRDAVRQIEKREVEMLLEWQRKQSNRSANAAQPA